MHMDYYTSEQYENDNEQLRQMKLISGMINYNSSILHSFNEIHERHITNPPSKDTAYLRSYQKELLF